MASTYRTDAIVVAKQDRFEADRVFTLYTQKFGKVRAWAVSERKSASKLRGGLETFYYSGVVFVEGRRRNVLTEAVCYTSFPRIREDLHRSYTALRALRVFDRLVSGTEPDEHLWRLLTQSLEAFNEESLSRSQLYHMYYAFLWRLLDVLGYRFETKQCVRCEEKEQEVWYLAPGEGGVLCVSCRAPQEGVAVAPSTLRSLENMLGEAWLDPSSFTSDETQLNSVLQLCISQYTNA